MWGIILAITLAFLLMFFMSRILMEIYIRTLIKNRRHIKKRKKDQSFLDWFTYKPFHDIIPKSEISYILYYMNMALYVFLLLVTVVLSICNLLEPFRKLICSVQFIGIGIGIGARFTALEGKRK